MTEKSTIEEYLEKAGGAWIRADNVQTGDKLKVLTEPLVDDKTFDRPYLVFDAVLMRTGEQHKVRLGTKNVTRIAETLGKTAWKNKQIEVMSIENYPGLGRKGILFKGCGSPATQPKGVQLSIETIDTIRKSKDIVETNIALNESDFSVLPAGVRAELLKNGLVEVKTEGDVRQYLFAKEKCKPFLA